MCFFNTSGLWEFWPPKFCYLHRIGWSTLQQCKHCRATLWWQPSPSWICSAAYLDHPRKVFIGLYRCAKSGYCHMDFIANFIRFPAVQKFWKTIKIWQSYRDSLKVRRFLRHSVVMIDVVVSIIWKFELKDRGFWYWLRLTSLPSTLGVSSGPPKALLSTTFWARSAEGVLGEHTNSNFKMLSFNL